MDQAKTQNKSAKRISSAKI